MKTIWQQQQDCLQFVTRSKERVSKSAGKYKVNVGFTPAGREKNVYFESLDAAKRTVSKVFETTKIVLSITEA